MRDDLYNTKDEFSIKKTEENKEAKISIPEDKPMNNVLLKTILNSNKNSKRENEFKRDRATNSSLKKDNDDEAKKDQSYTNEAYEPEPSAAFSNEKLTDEQNMCAERRNSDELIETINNLDTGSINKFEYRSKC